MPKWLPEIRFEWALFGEAGAAWNTHNAPRLGAALAYYAIFSLAPLLLIFISIAGIVFGRDAVRGEIYTQIRAVAGVQSAGLIEGLLKSATMHKTSGIIVSILGFVTLLLGASGVFVELRDDLNYIWEIPPSQESMIGGMLRYRLFAFGLVLGSGLLITASLAVSIAISAIEKYALGLIMIPGFLLETANFVLTFIATAILFGLVYTIVPQRRVPWKDVIVGSIVTAALFTTGKALVGLYLGRAGVGSLYGAAGSLVILLVWIYYSSQIFLFGAEFTHVYSRRHGILSKGNVPPKRPVVPIDTNIQSSRR